jgi:hypothetical protein
MQSRLVDGQEQALFDPWLVRTGRFQDIASGSKPPDVAVALKVEGDDDCYGFTNESYRGSNVLRIPEWRLPKGHFVVEARVVSGEIQSDVVRFILRNDGPLLTDLWLGVPKRTGFLAHLQLRHSARPLSGANDLPDTVCTAQ